ncbi:MAG: haloacid dehalogenase-like hydrolase [Planctomycetota bacterium]|nr:haloacid dehalogenase-like hydrolase [Planctomycetota bacterium]
MNTHTTLDTLLAALDALEALRGGPAWVATDADGTLWHTDLADRAWHRVVGQRRIRPAADDVLRRTLARAGLASTGDVHQDAERLYQAYRDGVADDWTLLEAMTACYAGWTEAEVRAFGRDLARDEVAPRAYETTAALLRALVDRGHRVAVVSGSPRVLVDEALRTLDLPAALVVGADVERDGDVLTDRMREPVPWEEGKVRALAEHGVRAPVAFGDTLGDLHLLEAADALRVLVHPRPALRAKAVPGGAWCLFHPCRTVGGHEVAPPMVDRVIV